MSLDPPPKSKGPRRKSLSPEAAAQAQAAAQAEMGGDDASQQHDQHIDQSQQQQTDQQQQSDAAASASDAAAAPKTPRGSAKTPRSHHSRSKSTAASAIKIPNLDVASAGPNDPFAEIVKNTSSLKVDSIGSPTSPTSPTSARHGRSKSMSKPPPPPGPPPASLTPRAPQSPKSPHSKKSHQHNNQDSDDSGDEQDKNDWQSIKPPPPSSDPPAELIAQAQQRRKSLKGNEILPSPRGAAGDETKGVNNNVIVLKINVLDFMRKGSAFLKYGKHGYPHFRHFHIAQHNDTLIWYSKSKKLADTQIYLKDIDEIRLGQTTPLFEKHKAPELEKSSFSIMYDKFNKSLDVITKDPNDYIIWTRGLEELVSIVKSKSFSYVSELKSIELELPVRRGRRSSIALMSAAGVQLSEADNPLNYQPTYPVDKSAQKEVLATLSSVKKRYVKLYEAVHSRRFASCPQLDSMLSILTAIRDSAQKVDQWIAENQFGACDDELWRAGVDLESLDNMIAVLEK